MATSDAERTDGKEVEDGLISVIDLIAILAAGRWLIVLFIVLGVGIGILYGTLTPPTYLVEVKMVDPDAERSGGLGQLGGVAALVTGAMSSGSETQRNIAILQSRPFLVDFVESRHLLPVLFAERWDPARRAWLPPESTWLQRIGIGDRPNAAAPTAADGYGELSGNMEVEKEAAAGLVILKLEGANGPAIAEIANWLVQDLNRRVHQRRQLRSQRAIQFLQAELRSANVLETRMRVSRLIEDELTRQALLAGESESAFRIIDPAVPPERPASPRPVLGIALGAFLGMVAGIVAALLIPVVKAVRRRLAAA